MEAFAAVVLVAGLDLVAETNPVALYIATLLYTLLILPPAAFPFVVLVAVVPVVVVVFLAVGGDAFVPTTFLSYLAPPPTLVSRELVLRCVWDKVRAPDISDITTKFRAELGFSFSGPAAYLAAYRAVKLPVRVAKDPVPEPSVIPPPGVATVYSFDRWAGVRETSLGVSSILSNRPHELSYPRPKYA